MFKLFQVHNSISLNFTTNYTNLNSIVTRFQFKEKKEREKNVHTAQHTALCPVLL